MGAGHASAVDTRLAEEATLEDDLVEAEAIELRQAYTAGHLGAPSADGHRDNRDKRGKRAPSATLVTLVPWEPPAPLARAKDLPPFPTDALPDWVRDQVEAVAHFTQTPVDLSAAMALATLSTAVGGRYRVQVRGSWIEPCNLFIVASLPPGSRKSAVYAALTKPLYQAEKTLIGEVEPKILEAETLIDIARADADRAKKEVPKATDEIEKAKQRKKAMDLLGALLGLEEQKPPRPRLIADDITPEAAAELLAAQGGRLSVMSAEGGIFSILAGR